MRYHFKHTVNPRCNEFLKTANRFSYKRCFVKNGHNVLFKRSSGDNETYPIKRDCEQSDFVITSVRIEVNLKLPLLYL